MSHVTARTRVAVCAGGAAGWLSRVTGRGAGATISGRVINQIAPHALEELAAGLRVALVSATNGKTTTTRLLTAALETLDGPVATNSTGANLTSGLVPVLAHATKPGLAALEVDERVVARVVGPLRAELLVLGNLSRDQLDRYGEVHAVGAAWRAVAERHRDLHVVANASDPHVVYAAQPARVTWVRLGLPWRADASTCPSCGRLLDWSTDRFSCPHCGFAEPDADHALDGDTLVLAGTRHPLRLSLPGRWNCANAALAVVGAVTHFGVDPSRAVEAAGRVDTVAGRYMAVPLPDGRRARVFLAKNPAGWSEVLHWARATASPVVVAVNARVADGKDPSWLWDVPFEVVRGLPVAAAGDRCLDVAVRLRYGEVEHTVERDPRRAAASLPGSDPVLLCTYTQFSALYKRYGDDGA
ncbi:MAG: UDP-N-acetylmuramyl peptide synthase [Acidimicrobiia bacterium]